MGAMINNHIEYAVVLTVLSTGLASLDEIWDNDCAYEIISRASDGGLGDRAWELAEFALNHPVQADAALHEAHQRNPDIRRQAIDYIAACWRNGHISTPEETFILRGIVYENRDTFRLGEHTVFCKKLLSDLDASISCGLTFYCDHTVPKELWYEHLWVNVRPINIDKADAVIREAKRRLESAGLEPEEMFADYSSSRKTTAKL